MTYREFYFWLEGFLNGKPTLNYDEILIVQKKMENIKDEIDYSGFIKSRRSSELFNPIKITNKPDDDLGKPPKIVM